MSGISLLDASLRPGAEGRLRAVASAACEHPRRESGRQGVAAVIVALPADAVSRLAETSVRLLADVPLRPLAGASLWLLAEGSLRAVESVACEHLRRESAGKGSKR